MGKDIFFYKSNCKYFLGYVPCKPHKNEGVHCNDCQYFKETDSVVLIIKLGAIGDVIRTSPLLYKIWEEHPRSQVWWLTYSPDIVPKSVDKVLGFTLESILTLRATKFKLVINLDKDDYACGLTKMLDAEKKIGYILENGKPSPINSEAHPKFITGLFDDANQINNKTYLEEIFEICGWKFNKQEYILDCDTSISFNIPNNGKKIIGLNTGCGERWVSRLWSYDNWKELIFLLHKNNFFPLLLGGKQEDAKNMSLAKDTGAFYFGHFNLKEFISLVNHTDIVVTAVTMGLHIAVGLRKKVVLMNNIFNSKEFELYGRGIIVQPEKECKCFFSPKCKNPEYFCMDSLKPLTIFNSIQEL